MSAAVRAEVLTIKAGTAEYGGAVRSGGAADGVAHFAGIRYGERLDATERFSALGDPSPEHAQGASTVFPQSPGSLDWLIGPALSRLPQSEDSFLLDIWAPRGAQDLPVLVFLPGGAFVSGAGNASWYDGARLAAEGGAVVVTVSYRLGALALLGGPDTPVNLGAQDILRALGWVSANIASFGGDPANVTLAGHSAGAWYAYMLSLAPQAKGLFSRAALFSLPWQPPLTPGAYRERWELFTEALRSMGPDSPGALATASAQTILEAQAAVGKAYAGRGLGLMPAADGDLISSWAMDFDVAAASLHVESLLLSSTENEAAAFLRALPVPAVSAAQLEGFLAAHFEDPGDVLELLTSRLPAATPHARLVEAMSLHQFRLAATELAGHASAAGVDTTLLRFSATSRLEGAGSPHCFELPFLFGNPGGWTDAPMLAGFPDAVFAAVSDQLRSLVLGFVHDGKARTTNGDPLGFFDAERPQMHTLTEAGLTTISPEQQVRARR
jgi:para-nitrobenzyl esterase